MRSLAGVLGRVSKQSELFQALQQHNSTLDHPPPLLFLHSLSSASPLSPHIFLPSLSPSAFPLPPLSLANKLTQPKTIILSYCQNLSTVHFQNSLLQCLQLDLKVIRTHSANFAYFALLIVNFTHLPSLLECSSPPNLVRKWVQHFVRVQTDS